MCFCGQRRYHRRSMHQHDLGIEQLRAACAGWVVGREIAFHQRLGSTMDDARRLAEAGAAEGLVVIAEEQTKGRGRFARKWESPVGENLLFSVLLRPQAGQMRYMNMAATLAVRDTVADVTGARPAIKWPNDVRVDGRKVAGILIESAVASDGRVDYAVVGIGLNVNFDPSPFPEIAETATSIARVLGKRVERTAVLARLLARLDGLYGEVRAGRSLTAAWAARLETLGRKVRVRSHDEVLEGLALRVDEEGNLVLRRPDGSLTTVVAGEVTMQA
ncbi:MAG: biotin--[acetyl-CoA-carboxylase] ligase [SAR202 cluster bacterium]|nr:biotin--[acetyl-CoA-carboxylase] ligase [SAR202 cluster bacterium]